MSNPLYNQFGGNSNDNFIANIMNEAKQLRQSIQGDPREIVQSLVNQGKISQQDLNRVFPMANQIANMMRR
ncbi:MAG: hypothetical protein U0K87_01940 [Ruminococcus sp.]|jgi:hypothetical protein|nr:hypothetical protein [Ruminococcus sp.]